MRLAITELIILFVLCVVPLVLAGIGVFAFLTISRRQAGSTRKCPYCAETIKAEAIVCRHCGRDIEPVKAETG